MPDLLTMYAQAHPDKLAVDRRPPRRATSAPSPTPSSRTSRTASPTCSLGYGVGPGVKVVWCGQNSTGVATLVVAARKLGATAVPLNYRLSDEEAAYVTDHSDATLVVRRRRVRPAVRSASGRRSRRSREVLVFDGPTRRTAMTAVDPLVAAAANEPPELPTAERGRRRR